MSAPSLEDIKHTVNDIKNKYNTFFVCFEIDTNFFILEAYEKTNIYEYINWVYNEQLKFKRKFNNKNLISRLKISNYNSILENNESSLFKNYLYYVKEFSNIKTKLNYTLSNKIIDIYKNIDNIKKLYPTLYYLLGCIEINNKKELVYHIQKKYFNSNKKKMNLSEYINIDINKKNLTDYTKKQYMFDSQYVFWHYKFIDDLLHNLINNFNPYGNLYILSENDGKNIIKDISLIYTLLNSDIEVMFFVLYIMFCDKHYINLARIII